MSAVTLYDYWRSSASYRVRIALGLKGIAWQAVSVDLLKGEHSAPAHLARNPQGLVPALEIDGLMLTQSLAIIEYLEETRPEPPLMPTDPVERARLRAAAYAIAMETHPLNNSSVLAHVDALTGGGQEARLDWMRHYMPKGLGAVETMLAGREPFAHGDAPGLVDICLVPQIYNARRWDIPVDPYPTLVAIDRACAGLPAFAAAHPDRAKPD